MTSPGADALLKEVLDKAIKNTAGQLPEVTEGVCQAHHGLHQSQADTREGVHALLLCATNKEHSAPEKLPTTKLNFMGMKLESNSANAEWLYRLFVTAIGLVVAGYVAVQVTKIKSEFAINRGEARHDSQAVNASVRDNTAQR